MSCTHQLVSCTCRFSWRCHPCPSCLASASPETVLDRALCDADLSGYSPKIGDVACVAYFVSLLGYDFTSHGSAVMQGCQDLYEDAGSFIGRFCAKTPTDALKPELIKTCPKQTHNRDGEWYVPNFGLN